MPAEKKVLVLVADGSEEIEVVVTVDVLRRAGLHVTLASVAGSGPVTCSRQVVITPDASLESIKGGLDAYEVLVLPGGGAVPTAFVASELVIGVIKEFAANSRLIAAICAGPLALKAAGVGVGGLITSHPSAQKDLEGTYTYSEERVVLGKGILTSRGPGTSFEFALAIVRHLKDQIHAHEVAAPMVL
ncbi:class I glutamine amidotransferase-like protein [Piptocephalis cylindrospora]|uniref:D-lactate dehydratase n=1 Tax=Piptocephalis cylindrospora TaxID=1907219 RepID=A0A4P9Y3G2_9FUNG|nr:class I glutamine amidotransferase-like protein [Piptocephalis cylindrospora]|eukprot:RKP13478.1 class I glutamine amidotransferase-like protein [Piptocephalis cylindrospora]